MIEIPKDTLAKWKVLYKQGDAWEMVSVHGEGAYPEMFQRALRLKRCNKGVFDTMTKYFDKKEKQIKKSLV